MKKNNKLTNLFLILFLFGIFIYMLYINTHTHKYHDEFVYSFIYGTTEKCENFIDVFKSLKNLYLMHNGRIISTGIMCILLMLPKIFSDILNSLFFTGLIFIILKYSNFRQNNKTKLLNLVLIFPLLWVSIPEFNGTITWFSGAVNYLWSTIFMLIYLSFFINNFLNNLNFSKYKIIIFSTLGILIGSLHESIGIITTSFLFFIFLYEIFFNRTIKKANPPYREKLFNFKKSYKNIILNYLLPCISSFIGFLTIILAPGVKIRSLATTSGNNIDLCNTFFNSITILKNTINNNLIIFILLFLSIIYFLVKNNFKNIFKNKFFMINIFFIFSAVLVYLSMIFSPTFAERVTFAPYVLFILSFFGILNLINIPNKLNYLIKFLLIIHFFILSVPSICETTTLIKQYYNEWICRDNFINHEKTLGKKDIQIEPFSTHLNDKMYGGDISTSISYNHNGSMAMYYNLNSIRIKKNFYIDLTFCNLQQENNSDTFTLSNSYETSTESISILPEYVLKKQAPYKSKKHSIIGGNITLYYGLNNIDNLKLSISTKSNNLCLKNIRIYNYENLDYTFKFSEIENLISSFHNLQILCGKDSLIFSHLGENPWIEFDFHLINDIISID